ncbi:transglutaminase family protein [Actinotalea sp. M2MS4P-6]|uniref:transglutaminase family protein n=1 Tax=Actinotalea sp. M2MS4P-6 TaxID=2983762 RepID=UPI0021E40C86|nr:transglutaminase family protein [Actinotalea sp. M2MS4P-6]MCV2393942.1 transglutaminase family protein [Actinotalea sp. M2MS4P-6]
MSRLHVVHTTTFGYDGLVGASYNEVRMLPRSEPRQTVLSATLEIDPSTWRHDFLDYWNTATTAFECGTPHRSLTLSAVSRVEVRQPALPAPLGWDVVRSDMAVDAMAEFLELSPTTEVPDELAELARESAGRPDSTPDDVARAICAAVHGGMEYVPGVTAVHSTAAHAWTERKGVCQDMAHLSVGALRSIGIPARYVSGYLHPAGEGEVGRTVVGESHAWVEWWVGHWVGHDPTNDIDVGEHHVVVGRGREYSDVPPVRGIFAGGGTQAMDVQVRITREA